MKKKNLKNKWALCGALICAVLLTTCEIDVDHSGGMLKSVWQATPDYALISSQPFIGGSVIYYPSAPEKFHLVPGAVIAVRLGYAKQNNLPNPQTGDEAAYIEDDSKPAVYGYLIVDAVSADSLSCDWTWFSASGNAQSKTIKIDRGKTCDLNSDGKADLRYDYPQFRRYGLESAVYLTFLSSKDDLCTAMFAVLHWEHPSGTGGYPSGIIGVNPDGKLIATATTSQNPFGKGVGLTTVPRLNATDDVSESAMLTRYYTQELFGLVPGDYVLAYNLSAAPLKDESSIKAAASSANPENPWTYHRVTEAAGNTYVSGSAVKITNAAHIKPISGSTSGEPPKRQPSAFSVYDFNSIQTVGNFCSKFFPALNTMYPAGGVFDMTGKTDAQLVNTLNTAFIGSDNNKEIGYNALFTAWALTSKMRPDGFDEFSQNYTSLSDEDMLISMRNYFAYFYPDDCPPAARHANQLSEVLPLVSWKFKYNDSDLPAVSGGSDSGSDWPRSVSAGAPSPRFAAAQRAMFDPSSNGVQPPDSVEFRITTLKPHPDLQIRDPYSENNPDYVDEYKNYIDQRADMQKKFKETFPGVIDINLGDIFSDAIVYIGVHPVLDIKLGIVVDFTCHWGHLKAEAGAGNYVQAEFSAGWEVGLSEELKSVLHRQINLFSISETITVGPVVLTLTIPLDFDLKMAGSVEVISPDVTFGGFTGYFGADASCGVDYGVKWKWGFIPIGINFKPFANADAWKQTANYYGPVYNSDNYSGVAGWEISLTVKPEFFGGGKITLYDIVWAKAGLTLGFPATFDYEGSGSELPYSMIEVDFDADAKIDVSVGVEFDILIWHKIWKIADWNLWNKKWNIFSHKWWWT